MPSLPIATDFTGAGVTEAGFKIAITNQREFLAGLLGTTGNQVDALVALGALGADTVSKTTAYTIIASDRGKAILCSGTFTLTLTAAATLGDGFTFTVINTGTGTITIDPNSTEQIDGASTKDIDAGSSAIIICTGTAFYSMGGGGVSSYTGGNVAVFGSSGSWTVPDGVTSAIITAIGGGGGARSRDVGPANGGPAGIAMAYCTGLSGSLSITIGAGGNGSTSGNGAAGGTTSITGTGVSLSATGGGGATQNVDGGTGTGTVTTGTVLRQGGLRHIIAGIAAISHPIAMGSNLSNSINGNAWSGAAGKSAGSGGTTAPASSGGVGGIVIIEW